jgi:hypothetical protein
MRVLAMAGMQSWKLGFLEMLFAMADEIESSHEQRELASPAPASSQRDPGDKDRGWLRVHNVGGSLTFLLQVFSFSPSFLPNSDNPPSFCVMCFFKVACFFLGLCFPPRLFSCFFVDSFCVCVCAFVFLRVAIRVFLWGFTCSSVCRGFQF